MVSMKLLQLGVLGVKAPRAHGQRRELAGHWSCRPPAPGPAGTQGLCSASHPPVPVRPTPGWASSSSTRRATPGSPHSSSHPTPDSSESPGPPQRGATPTGWPHTTQIHALPAPEARGLEPRCRQGPPTESSWCLLAAPGTPGLAATQFQCLPSLSRHLPPSAAVFL